MKSATNIIAPASRQNGPFIIIDRKAFRLAQSTAKEAIGEYEWKCAMYQLQLAYGVDAEEPFPVLGDVRGNYICSYSDINTGEYNFTHKRLMVAGE